MPYYAWSIVGDEGWRTGSGEAKSITAATSDALKAFFKERGHVKHLTITIHEKEK